MPSPDRFVLGEMFRVPSETGFRACIVTNTLDEEGQYGELIEIPSQERFAISRAALDAEWQPMACDGPWYVEQYSQGRDRPDWSAHVPDIEFVLALAKGARHRGQGEIIRYRTGNYVSPLDVGRLRFTGATRLP